MKRLLIVVVSTISLTAGLSMKVNANEVTPDEIYNLARNGYFEDEGIPSHAGLTNAYRVGRVTAEDLINAAIQQNRLSSEVLDNRRFIRAVNQYLQNSSHGN